jgi:DNA-nicking Smr family endonuclease
MTVSRPREREMWNIWRAKNPRLNDPNTTEADFHGLYLTEAMDRLHDVIRLKCRQNRRNIRFITGRGLHSAHGKPVIKPAFKAYFDQNRLRYNEAAKGGAFDVTLKC